MSSGLQASFLKRSEIERRVINERSRARKEMKGEMRIEVKNSNEEKRENKTWRKKRREKKRKRGRGKKRKRGRGRGKGRGREVKLPCLLEFNLSPFQGVMNLILMSNSSVDKKVNM